MSTFINTQTIPLPLLPVTPQSAAGCHGAGGVLCTPVNHCREKADPSKAGKTIYTSESQSDLRWKGPLQNTSTKPNILLTYFVLWHFGFPLAAG